ncbi:MAG: patatin-like phospholipase family protein [Candidatus Krumholzibacteriia bacterium]
MRRRALAVLAAAVLSAATAAPARPDAAQEPAQARPRIGLALGGGGARGGAHIGVLQVLHEMRVPIDYVAGTSMGAVVGALYSVGLPPARIEAEMCGVDWDDLFSDRPARDRRTFRRKQDDSASFLPLEFGLQGRRIVLAPGLIAGQKLSFAFREPRLHLAGHDSFDDLAYPFRPVATDLQTGEVVVIERGNLLKAVRASMSIPGVFPPVAWEGRLLVDGYLARNVPVDVVRAMGADIVIAVDVGQLPDSTDAARLQTLIGIAEQTGLIQARQNVVPQLALADIVLRPDPGDVSTRDFARVTDTFAAGAAATRAAAAVLAPLALDEAAYARHLARHVPPPPGPITIDRVAVHTDASVDVAHLHRLLRRHEGREMDFDELKEDLTQIYDFGVFALVDFQLTRAPADGRETTTLTVVADRKPYEPYVLNFGLAYEGGEAGRSELNARARITALELNVWGGEVRTDLQLGQTDAVRSEWYQPLGWSRRTFFAVRGTMSNRLRSWYDDLVRRGDYLEKDYHLEGHLGLRLGRAGEIRAGLLHGYLRTAGRTGLNLTEVSGRRGGLMLQTTIDVMDAAVFPRHGLDGTVRAYVSLPGLGPQLDHGTLEGIVRLATSPGEGTFTGSLQGGTRLGGTLPEFAMFTAGGLGRLAGYQREQLRGEAYGIAAAGWYTRLGGRAGPYATQWYAGLLLEAGNAWRPATRAGLDDLRGCGSVFLGARTLLGPVLLTYARAAGGNDAVYATLGSAHALLD